MQHKGQVYIPMLNYLLMILCVIVVATFQTSVKLTRAYGDALQRNICFAGVSSTLHITYLPAFCEHQHSRFQ